MIALQLNPPFPVLIFHQGEWQKAQSHIMLDYGIENDLYWVCFLDSNGECWTMSNRYVRMQENVTIGRAFTGGGLK